jgi:hypothetical protein
MGHEKRRNPRFIAAFPVRFNLDPKHHFVPRIRKTGIGGTVRDVSSEGLRIESEMDMLDVCQIFHEAIEDDSVFGLELVVSDSEHGKTPVRGEVRWYRVGDPQNDVRDFRAGLHLKDAKSRSAVRTMIESISRPVKSSKVYRDLLDLRGFRLAGNRLLGAIKNTGDKTARYLVIETRCRDPQGKVVSRKLYRAVPYGKAKKVLKPGMTLRVAVNDREIPPSAASVEVSVRKLSLD